LSSTVQLVDLNSSPVELNTSTVELCWAQHLNCWAQHTQLLSSTYRKGLGLTLPPQILSPYFGRYKSISGSTTQDWGVLLKIGEYYSRFGSITPWQVPQDLDSKGLGITFIQKSILIGTLHAFLYVCSLSAFK
jgi:hypothetical protein